VICLYNCIFDCIFYWLYNYVFADLLIVFDVYPCLLWISCMSANIQFTETGNLLSPDKGDMSGFFLVHPVFVRCVGVSAVSGGRWLVSGGLARTCNLRAGVVADRILAVVLFRWVRWAAGRQRCLWPNYFFGLWH